MNSKTIDALLNSQRNFFQSGATLPVSFRIDMLKKLYAAVKKYENEVTRALKTDLGKSDFEGFMCETGLAGPLPVFLRPRACPRGDCPLLLRRWLHQRHHHPFGHQ